MVCCVGLPATWGEVGWPHESTSASECQEGDFGCSCRPFGRTEWTCEVLTSLFKIFAGKIVKRIPRCSEFVEGLSLVADLMHYIYRGSTAAVGRLQIGAF